MINGKLNRTRLETIEKNQYTFRRYYLWIKDLATSLFEWENLPDSCDSRFLEETLFKRGEILFFHDESLGDSGYLHLPFVNDGKLGVYGQPIDMRPYSITGYTTRCTDKDSVIIYNNSVKKGDDDVARYYAEQIYEIKRSMDTNIKTQKFPFLLTGPQQQTQTLKNVYKQVDMNEPVVIANDKFSDINEISVLKTDATFVADKLHLLYESIMQEVCEYFGINASQDKKERMVVSEVMSGIGMTEANRQIRLKTRKDACEKINKMFGLDIDVRFRTDVDMMEQLLQLELRGGLLDDGSGGGLNTGITGVRNYE